MFQGPVTSSRNCCRRAYSIFPVCRPSSGQGAVGIDKGFMTTVHAYTNDQPSHD
jgi:Glyceraldehyde 3-phosphate dehydrogenase, C-terminal domain